MSKAGQHTVSGVNDQANIALLYLLRAGRFSNFQRMIVEGADWDDFTLFYSDRTENYEVKSHRAQFSFGDFKALIPKDFSILKNKEQNTFKIIVREMSPQFKKIYRYMQGAFFWVTTPKSFKKDRAVKLLTSKGWNYNQIFSLSKIEVVEFLDIKFINNQIQEYFYLEENMYLDDKDIEFLRDHLFSVVMVKGKTGGSIERAFLLEELKSVRNYLIDKSESFGLKIKKDQRFNRVKPYLTSAKKFKELEKPSLLSPISAYPFLIFYISDILAKNDFDFDEISFFVEKVLLKQYYVRDALKLIEHKYKKGKIRDEHTVSFIIKYYDRLLLDFNYDDALKLIRDIVKKNSDGRFDGEVTKFISDNVLKVSKDAPRKRRGWQEQEIVSEIIDTLFHRSANKHDILGFIFKNYDFTSDSFELVSEVPGKIYLILREYILENFSRNYKYVVDKIAQNFTDRYSGMTYRGYEVVGSGVSQGGSAFSITDIGVVRNLFKPIFLTLYDKNSEQMFRWLVQAVLNPPVSAKNPIYLKRASIPILLKRLQATPKSDRGNRQEVIRLINALFKDVRGIPNASDIFFQELRGADLNNIGYETVMEFIETESIKYSFKKKYRGCPNNVFTIEVLAELINSHFEPAEKYLMNFVRRKDFSKFDWKLNVFEILAAKQVPQKNPRFISKIFESIQFEDYLNRTGRDIVWDKSKNITELIKTDWKEGTARGLKIFKSLLRTPSPSEKALDFLAGPLHDLGSSNPIETFRMIEPYLKRAIFDKKFKNSSQFRCNLASLAQELAKVKHYEEAKQIIKLCIIDSDPNTDAEKSYHLTIKKGGDASIITSVRGWVGWALQQFVVSNKIELMEYAYKNTKLLLDLDGVLAKKLSYSEPDLYVRTQALVPWSLLAQYGRRKMFSEAIQNDIKDTSLQLLAITEKAIKSEGDGKKKFGKQLALVFQHFRDLSTEDAKTVLGFFERHDASELYGLFIYYALYRANHFQDVPFRPEWFIEKLKELSLSNDVFRRALAWEVWRILYKDPDMTKTENDKDFIGDKKYLADIDEYWKLIFSRYDKESADFLYRTMEITLKDVNKFSEHFPLFKKLWDLEIAYWIKNGELMTLWEPGGSIFSIIGSHDIKEALKLFLHVLSSLETKETVYYCHIRDWIKWFEEVRSKGDDQDLCKKIESALKKTYPEMMTEAVKTGDKNETK